MESVALGSLYTTAHLLEMPLDTQTKGESPPAHIRDGSPGNTTDPRLSAIQAATGGLGSPYSHGHTIHNSLSLPHFTSPPPVSSPISHQCLIPARTSYTFSA